MYVYVCVLMKLYCFVNYKCEMCALHTNTYMSYIQYKFLVSLSNYVCITI